MGKIIPQSSGAMSVPEWMKEHQLDGAEMLKEYVIPPRVKIVQPTAREPISERFKQGDLIVSPSLQLLSPYEKDKVAFYFVPVFFWPEWIVVNPLETQGTLKMIRGRTLDKTHEIAIKSRDEDRRNSEPCPEVPEKDGKKLYLKYKECLNFMVVPFNAAGVETALSGLPLCVTYSGGEWRTGSNFSALIQTRRAPIYGCQFQANVRPRQNAKGRWYGIDMGNPETPDVPAWTPQEGFEALQGIHREYKAAWEKKMLQVDYDDPSEEETNEFK